MRSSVCSPPTADVPTLGTVDKLVERGDLVEPPRLRDLRDRFDRRPSARPSETINAVGSTRMRAWCWFAAAIAVKRSCVSLTAAPDRLNARPTCRTKARSS
jgi:hypothetical protein